MGGMGECKQTTGTPPDHDEGEHCGESVDNGRPEGHILKVQDVELRGQGRTIFSHTWGFREVLPGSANMEKGFLFSE